MKNLSLFICILFSSCSLDGLVEEGINIDILNKTNTEFKSATMYVGAIKNNQFIVTDSIKPNNIVNISFENDGSEFTFGDWNPNLKKVFNISNDGVLYCEIKGGLNLFFEPFDKNKFGRYNHFGGSTGIIILNEDNTFTYTSNRIEKQDFEIVK